MSSVVKRVREILDENANDEDGAWLTETFFADLQALLALAEAADAAVADIGLVEGELEALAWGRLRDALRAVREERDE